MQIATPVNVTPVNQGAAQEKGGILQNMRPGQSITVEVVSADPGFLNVKTTDGQTLRAEFPGATVMAPGDKLQLSLLSNEKTGNPQFKLSMVNGQNVGVSITDMEAKMIDLGVEPSVFNVKSAEFLAERGVLPTPERIATLAKIASYYPQMPAAAALFVAANGIPVTRPNMYALMEWLQGGEMLGEQAHELTEAVRQMLSGAQGQDSVKAQPQTLALHPEAQQSKLSPQNTGAFIQSFVGEVTKNPNLPKQTISDGALKSFAQTLANTAPQDVSKVIESFLKNYPSLGAAEKNALAQILGDAYKSARAKAENPKQDILNGTQASAEAVTETPVKTSELNKPADLAAQNSKDAGQTPKTAQTQENNIAGATELNSQPANAAQKGEISAQTEKTPQKADISIVSGNAVTNSPDKDVAANQQKTADTQASVTGVKSTAAQDEEIGKILKQLTGLVASMKNDTASDAETLQQAVKNQRHAAEAIKDGLSKIAGDTNPAAQKAADMSAKVNIGSQLDNFYYCQVPFQVGENSNTAEFYVFKRKKQGAGANKTNTTILIALETQRMGRVETVLKAEEAVLNIEFRVDSDAVQKYIERAASELKRQLEESDFKVLDIRVTRIQIPVTPLNVDQVLGEKEEFKLKTIDISV